VACERDRAPKVAAGAVGSPSDVSFEKQGFTSFEFGDTKDA
jgi:hypothetical protein